MTPKIYIAGPDVFAPNAAELSESLKESCKKYGFRGVFPLDIEPGASAEEIFKANCAKIDDADYIVANINAFRGHCMDDGTAFEIGYAYTKGKIVYAYTSDSRSLTERIGSKDENGWNVENFNKPVNLMIAFAVRKIVIGSFEDCVAALYERFGIK